MPTYFMPKPNKYSIPNTLTAFSRGKTLPTFCDLLNESLHDPRIIRKDLIYLVLFVILDCYVECVELAHMTPASSHSDTKMG